MKTIYIGLLSIVLILQYSLSYTQSFISIGDSFSNNDIRILYPDTITGNVYAGATGFLEGTIPVWNGQSWVWDSTTDFEGSIFGIERFKGDLYVGGLMWYAVTPTVNDGLIARMKTQGSWEKIATNSTATIWGMISDSNYLYVLGNFHDSIAGIAANMIARYDGEHWDSPYEVLDPSGGGPSLNTAMIYKGELYVGGNYMHTLASSGLNDIAKWDGSHWVSVGGGLPSGAGWVSDFEIYQGDLIAAGWFFSANGDPGNCIARWDGTQWHNMGLGISAGQINQMQIYKGELYVSGTFAMAGGIPVNRFAKWDGTQWKHTGLSFDNATFAMCVMGDDLYIGGGFWHVNGIPAATIIKYNSTTNSISPQDKDAVFFPVYPNPAQASVAFCLPATTVGKLEHLQLQSIDGTSLIASLPFEQQGEEVRFSVADVPQGVYLLHITIGEMTYVQRLVKE